MTDGKFVGRTQHLSTLATEWQREMTVGDNISQTQYVRFVPIARQICLYVRQRPVDVLFCTYGAMWFGRWELGIQQHTTAWTQFPKLCSAPAAACLCCFAWLGEKQAHSSGEGARKAEEATRSKCAARLEKLTATWVAFQQSQARCEVSLLYYT